MMMSREKNSAGPTSLHAAMISRSALRAASIRLQALEMLVRVLDHDDRRVDHRADRDGDAAQAHDVGVDAEQAHRDERDQHADRQHDDRDQRASHVHQED